MHFDFVDRVLELTPERIVTLKNVAVSEEYLQDHFPTFPVLPGVFMIEAMVQAARRLLAGRDDPEEIVRSVDHGIYAAKFGGGQVDISNGDFVFSLTEGYLIEHGKITAPLKGVNLIGNGPDVMRKVVALGADFETSDGIWTCGKDGQSVPVGVGCPTVKISSVTVGGTEIGR